MNRLSGRRKGRGNRRSTDNIVNNIEKRGRDKQQSIDSTSIQVVSTEEVLHRKLVTSTFLKSHRNWYIAPKALVNFSTFSPFSFSQSPLPPDCLVSQSSNSLPGAFFNSASFTHFSTVCLPDCSV